MLVFALGAAFLAVWLRLVRSVVVKALAPWGAKLDRWRRRGAEPERDLALLLGNLFILGFVDGFAVRYGLSFYLLHAVGLVWMVHLPADIANRVRNAKGGPADVHRRGFFVFKFGSIWRRLALALVAFAMAAIWVYLLGHPVAPVRDYLAILESFVS